MKLRNRLLALFCLLVFIAFGVFFFRTWVVQKPFGIIVFLSDGLSTNTLTAARLYEGGGSNRLTSEQFARLALVRNDANDFAVPDAAAAASAIATGVKVNNRSIAMDPNGKMLQSILALARESGRATGLVTTGNLTDATPAAFYAHTTDPNDEEAIAEQFLGEAMVDIALGGGLSRFTPESKGGRRTDGRDLWLELRGKGYAPVRTKAELENMPTFLSGPLVGIFADETLAYSSEVESGSQQPSLSDMVRRAIEFLQTNRSGYLLVVDCASISRAAQANDGDRVLSETLEFDRALALARRYAGDQTLIVAVGKQDVGGMTLNGYPLRDDRGVALLGTNASGYPSITWSTGPAGAPSSDEPTPEPTPAAEGQPTPPPARPARSEPAAYEAPHAIHSARDMILIGSGPGSEPINGFMDNTAVFGILRNQL